MLYIYMIYIYIYVCILLHEYIEIIGACKWDFTTILFYNDSIIVYIVYIYIVCCIIYKYIVHYIYIDR